MTAVRMSTPVRGVIAYVGDDDRRVGCANVWSGLEPWPGDPSGEITLTPGRDDVEIVMTCEQALGIEERLADARASVDAALDAEPFEPVTLTEATTCDCCGYSMPVGTEAVPLSDERRSDFYAHFGRCPMTWGTIEVAVQPADNPRRVRVRARIYGLWAMNRSVLDVREDESLVLSDAMVVTHIPTGRCAMLGTGVSMREPLACRLVAALGAECSTDAHRVLEPGSDAWKSVARVASSVLASDPNFTRRR